MMFPSSVVLLHGFNDVVALARLRFRDLQKEIITASFSVDFNGAQSQRQIIQRTTQKA